jgi:hypothetical protein
MDKTTRTEALLIAIGTKLDRLIGLTAIQGKTKDEQIRLLVGLGFSNAQVSVLTGIPKGTVDTTRAKKKRR